MVTFNKIKPPLSPAARRSRSSDNATEGGDTAKYILVPDSDFERPYLAVPDGNAFIWPLGTEGFELTETAELGKHKYLGEIELDVDIIHKSETNIILSGIFPGHTSVDNMLALRQIFYADTPERGKILHLPGILPFLQYVVGESMRFSHPEDDRTQDISYSCTFVKVGTGKAAPGSAGGTVSSSAVGTSSDGPVTAPPKGSFTKFASAQPGQNTLRQFARTFLGNANNWAALYNDPRNHAIFDALGIASHEVPDYALPTGTQVWV